MLGSALGTDLLNGWVNAINDGMTLEDIANHIAASDDFTTTYPTFLTNEEFATSFLENLMSGEEVSAALVSAAVGIVTGLLNDGMTRGAIATSIGAEARSTSALAMDRSYISVPTATPTR